MPISQLTTQGGGIDFKGNIQWGWFPGSVAGTYYVVINDDINSITYVDKTTDYGVTWAQVGSTTDVSGSLSTAFNAGVIYIYGENGPAQPSFTPQPVRVARFNTAGDTFLSSLIPPSPLQGDFGIVLAIGVKSNGDLAVAYNGAEEIVGGIHKDRVFTSEFSGGVWSAGAQISGQAGFAYSFYASQILVPPSNRLVLIMGSEEPSRLAGGEVAYVITKPNAGAWQTLQIAAADLTTTQDDFNWPIGCGCTFVDTKGAFGPANASQFFIPYVGGGDSSDHSGGLLGGPVAIDRVIAFQEADNPTFVVTTVDSTNAIVPMQQAYENIVGMTFDSCNNTLYYMWVNQLTKGVPAWSIGETVTTSGNVLYRSNTGSGWSSSTVLQAWAAPFVPSGVNPIALNGAIGALFYVIDSTNYNGGDPVAMRHWITQFSSTPCPSSLTLTCPVGGSTGQVGVFYSKALVVIGGAPPYTFALIAGSLPPGLTLNTITGVISGTPTFIGTFSYTIRVTDSLGATATITCPIVIGFTPLVGNKCTREDDV